MKKFNYKRILIVGCPGAGKSTMALDLSGKTNLPVVHLDKLLWLPNWVKREKNEFDALMEKELQKPEWIIEGNFRRTFAHRLTYADFCIYLNYKKSVCVNGVNERVKKYAGKTRPDMTEGCLEMEDPDFINYITDFNKSVRPEMIKVLKKSKCPYKILKSRKQAERWIKKVLPNLHNG